MAFYGFIPACYYALWGRVLAEARVFSILAIFVLGIKKALEEILNRERMAMES